MGSFASELDEQQDGDESASPFTSGEAVGWAGPAEVAAMLHLTPGHPGQVRDCQPKSVIVRWVNQAEWFDHVGVFDHEWLEPITNEEFDRRARRLRDSAWPGFPPGNY